MADLSVPPLGDEHDTLDAALAYAAGGWYVGPVKCGTKHPGSVLGDGWQQRTSREPEVIVAWLSGTDHGLFLHVGRSGGLVFDVDQPGRLPAAIRQAVEQYGPPFQSTRVDEPGRGHYVFAQPPGRDLSNSVGDLGGDWGEVRGRNGVIIVAPSEHQDAVEGGRYQWTKTGRVPTLPGYLASRLPDALNAAEAASDTQVSSFLDANTASDRPELLDVHVAAYLSRVKAGESRHSSMTGHIAGAMKEAAAGLIDAKLAADSLESVFLNAVAQSPIGKQGGPRHGAVASSEWRGLLAWAVAQARAADPAATLARVTEKVPSRVIDVDWQDAKAGGAPTSLTLDQAHGVFRRWLGEEYDLDALDVVLATAAVERLDGDPLWLLLISGSGNAKTETVQALDGIGALVTSTISSAGALLSGTSRKEQTSEATGGLLRKIGEHGVLVIKDVTSVLSASRDARAEVLAALREVYDGRWSRNVGTDGGKTLEWTGRIALVGAVTTAWDGAHDVIAAMGDRFVLVRMDSTTGRLAAGRRAIANTGDEIRMRAELAEAVAGVLAGANLAGIEVTEHETEHLLRAADLVTRARTGVIFDYRGDVIDAHAPEMPTRFAKQLAQVVRGAVAIGIRRQDGLRLAVRCARDSVPPLRLAVIDDLAAHPGSTVSDVRRRINKPRSTVDRQLQALHMLDIADVAEVVSDTSGVGGGKQITSWLYTIAKDTDPEALNPSQIWRYPHTRTQEEGEYAPPAISGEAA